MNNPPEPLELQGLHGIPNPQLAQDKALENPTHSRKEYSNIYKNIIDYLNLVSGKNYKSSTKKTQSHIKARLEEGFVEDDFKRVINTKVKEWENDPKFKNYIRPETLFGTKFESYLNQNSGRDTYKEDSITIESWD